MPVEKPVVVLFSRKDCHLCDVAERVLRAELEAREVTLRKVDVDEDPELMKEYGNDVPVVSIAGKTIFRHRVAQAELVQVLDEWLT